MYSADEHSVDVIQALRMAGLGIVVFAVVSISHCGGEFASAAGAPERCAGIVQDVRRASNMYLGMDWPWWYNVGAAAQESACRQDAVSFDGGVGLFQFTPSTGVVVEVSRAMGERIDPADGDQNVRAHAYYMGMIYNKHLGYWRVRFKGEAVIIRTFRESCGKPLWLAYQMYNGGWWPLYEVHKAGYSCDRAAARAACTRGGVQVGGRWLDFCDVNYEYPERVYEYGKAWMVGDDGLYVFWSEPPADVPVMYECGQCHDPSGGR